MENTRIWIPGKKAIDVDAFFDYVRQSTEDEAGVYASIAWFFRCLNLRADAMAGLPREIKRGETVIDSPYPLRDLLWKIEAAMLLHGAAYVWKRKKMGKLDRLQWLNPSSIRPIVTSDGITHFERIVNGAIREHPVKDIVYIHSWNPSCDLSPGIAPGAVALSAAGIQHDINEWSSSFFTHGGIPAIILVSKEGRIDQAESERAQSAWDKMFAGAKKFKTAVIGAALQPHVIGSPVKDVAMPELTASIREQICVAFGVPESIILENAANRATALSHRRSFYTEVVVPQGLLIAEELNAQLFSELRLVFRFKPTELECFQEEEKDRSEALLRFVQAGMPLEAAVQILGIDVPEGVDITPTTIPGAMPQMPQLRDWRKDLGMWERMALKYMKEQGHARYPFESKSIPSTVAHLLQARLAAATTEAEVKAAFAATFQNESEMGGVPGPFSEAEDDD